jgi:hypothetical protein
MAMSAITDLALQAAPATKARGGRLAAAGFADDPDGFTLGDVERHVIDRAHRLALAEQLAAHGKMFCQSIDLQQRLRGAAAILDRLKQFDRCAGFIHGVNSGCPWRCACRR